MDPLEHAIERNVPLSLHTTFKIGGEASYFGTASSIDELRAAVLFAQEKDLPFFVLGEGSNLLVSDDGFDGVVIKIAIRGLEWKNLSPQKDGSTEEVEVVMGAGEHWDDVVAASVARGLSGFENLSGIPGTVGAAPVQNIGAYGREIKDTLSWVEVFDTKTLQVRRLQSAECAFGYRDAIFKTAEGKHLVITRVACVLRKNVAPDFSYKDIQKFFSQKISAQGDTFVPTVQEVRDAVLSIRAAKLPDLAHFGTAGSFFKNPIISAKHFEALKTDFPNLPSFDAPDGRKKVSAAWILDNVCGFKGYRAGNVGVYQNQSLVLVNFGGASAQEVIALSSDMRVCVKKNTDIDIFPEVVMLGF